EIVRFVNEPRQWELVAVRSSSSQPMPLSGGAGKKMGVLEVLAARLKQVNPGMEVVRPDTGKNGDSDVGMLIGRYGNGAQRHLVQQAVIQANDQLYYLLTMNSPSAKDAAAEDPTEKAAVEAFQQMLDSVKLLDRSGIKGDQDERLFRSRAF